MRGIWSRNLAILQRPRGRTYPTWGTRICSDGLGQGLALLSEEWNDSNISMWRAVRIPRVCCVRGKPGGTPVLAVSIGLPHKRREFCQNGIYGSLCAILGSTVPSVSASFLLKPKQSD